MKTLAPIIAALWTFSFTSCVVYDYQEMEAYTGYAIWVRRLSLDDGAPVGPDIEAGSFATKAGSYLIPSALSYWQDSSRSAVGSDSAFVAYAVEKYSRAAPSDQDRGRIAYEKAGEVRRLVCMKGSLATASERPLPWEALLVGGELPVLIEATSSYSLDVAAGLQVLGAPLLSSSAHDCRSLCSTRDGLIGLEWTHGQCSFSLFDWTCARLSSIDLPFHATAATILPDGLLGERFLASLEFASIDSSTGVMQHGYALGRIDCADRLLSFQVLFSFALDAALEREVLGPTPDGLLVQTIEGAAVVGYDAAFLREITFDGIEAPWQVSRGPLAESGFVVFPLLLSWSADGGDLCYYTNNLDCVWRSSLIPEDGLLAGVAISQNQLAVVTIRPTGKTTITGRW